LREHDCLGGCSIVGCDCVGGIAVPDEAALSEGRPVTFAPAQRPGRHRVLAAGRQSTSIRPRSCRAGSTRA